MTIKVYIYYKYLVNSLLQIHVLKIGGLWILEDSNYWIITLCSWSKIYRNKIKWNSHLHAHLFKNIWKYFLEVSIYNQVILWRIRTNRYFFLFSSLNLEIPLKKKSGSIMSCMCLRFWYLTRFKSHWKKIKKKSIKLCLLCW